MTQPARPLEISSLRVTGDGGRTLLTIPDLRVAPGSAIAVRGPSGAGKSTFLYAIAGLIPIAGGAVRWGDTDIAQLREPQRARFRRDNIGFVFQEHLLFEELSAPDNAALAALYAPRRTRPAIRTQGAAHLTRLGLDHGDPRRSDTYSGGERQRIAVARALASDPVIILADEPTASLDRANADRLSDDLVQLARGSGRTLIAVSHDPALHDRADRVIDIRDGRIMGAADG